MSNGPGAVFRRPRAPLDKKALASGHGKPLHCPKCCVKEETFYGRLKLPGERDAPCPNCGTKLVPGRSHGEPT